MVHEKPNTTNFTKCPVCWSEKRIAKEVGEQQVEKGNLPKGLHAFMFQHQSVIAGAPGTWISAPVILSFYDVCKDCGTVYCVHTETRIVVQGGKMPSKPNFQSN